MRKLITNPASQPMPLVIRFLLKTSARHFNSGMTYKKTRKAGQVHV